MPLSGSQQLTQGRDGFAGMAPPAQLEGIET